MMTGSLPPVKEGDIIQDLKIIGIGRKGDGIGKVDNFVVIVPETDEGQSYTVEINKVLSTVAFGQISIQ